MAIFVGYPAGTKRNALYWLNPSNLWAARRKVRRDNSLDWRRAMEARYPARSPDRSVAFSTLLEKALPPSFRFLILADTGEGDYSQYGTIPLIRAMDPAFLIINGDVAYPAGRHRDFERGFFKPYTGLNVPIWATPGNHEYYSPGKGQEFFEIFCTSTQRNLWTQAGLRQGIPQPGTYFELKEPGTGSLHLVVIGIDSGQTGNLDGKGWRHEEDRWQHEWLRWRLGKADEEGKSVIVMFHIPALRDGKHDSSTHLTRLHQLIAAHDCVRLVLCGHIHNFQSYSSAEFQRYLADHHQVPGQSSGQRLPRPPYYLVAGGGGAYLESTDLGKTPYRPARLFPCSDEWKAYVTTARRLLDRAGFTFESALARAALGMTISAAYDQDLEKFLSFVSIEVSPDSIHAVAVFLEDGCNDPFPPPLPSDVRVNVTDPNPPVPQGAIETILNRGVRVQLWP